MVKTKLKWQGLMLCLMLWASMAQAQSPYTLDECLQMALENNLQIKAAETDRRKAAQQIAETRAALLPQISGEYQFTYSPDLPVTFLPGVIVGQPEVENVSLALGLQQTQYAGFTASQQLFNPQLFSALKAVKTAKALTALQASQTKEEVVFDVSATYYRLLSLYQSMDLLQANIKSFETSIETTETLQRNGLAKKSDVSRLMLAKKALETQLMNLKVTETTLLNVLRLLTHSPDDLSFRIDTDVKREVELITMSDSTVSRRSDYRLLQTSIELKEIERKGVLASYMPTIVLFGGYYSYAFNSDFNPIERAEDQSFPVSQIGLSLQLPIFDGGERRAQTRQKSLELEKLHYQEQLVQQQARNEMLNAIEKYRANLAILNMEKENMDLAQTTLDETKTNYRNGFASITDIIDAENDLLKTQTDYIHAIVNIRLAGLEWKKANGTLVTLKK